MNKLICSGLLGFALLQLLAPDISNAGAGTKLVVIVAKGSGIKDISKAELKRAFLGDTVVVDGKKLVPFNFSAGTSERGWFDRAILGMSGDVVKRFWVDRKIRGQPDAPRGLPSADIVIKVATKFPGAIAYIPEGALTSDVQALTVDGVPYTHPSYPITE